MTPSPVQSAASKVAPAAGQIVTMAIGALVAGIIMPIASAIGENIADRWIRKPKPEAPPKGQQQEPPKTAANDQGPPPPGARPHAVPPSQAA